MIFSIPSGETPRKPRTSDLRDLTWGDIIHDKSFDMGLRPKTPYYSVRLKFRMRGDCYASFPHYLEAQTSGKRDTCPYRAITRWEQIFKEAVPDLRQEEYLIVHVDDHQTDHNMDDDSEEDWEPSKIARNYRVFPKIDANGVMEVSLAILNPFWGKEVGSWKKEM